MFAERRRAAPRSALLLGAGVLGLFAGIALLAPRLVKPLARVVGWPARRAGGVAGELAGANAVRNPGRTASTAAALMIGLTLVTVVAVLGAGLQQLGTKSAITDQLHADYVVDGDDGLPFRAAEGDTLARDRRASRRPRTSAPTRRCVQGEEQRDQRHRPGDDRALLHVQLDRRAPTARSASSATDGAIVDQGLRQGQRT